MAGSTITLDSRTVPYTPGSLEFDSTFGARAQASVQVIDRDGLYDYGARKGMEAVITDDLGAVAFRGILTNPKWSLYLGTDAVAWALGLDDLSALADRVCVFDYFSSATHPLTSDIVRSILTDYLAQFGVTEGVIEEGSAVSEVTYNGQKATVALNELAKRDAYQWRIDDARRLHYQAQTSYAAPWHITAALGQWDSMGGSSSLSTFANRVHQRGSPNGVSDLRTESYPGDGVRREFKLLYSCYSNVSIKVNGVAKTLGIKGVDSGKDFYWKQGDDIVQQDEAGTILGAGDTIAVTYRGRVSMFVQLEDVESIAARAAAEGTSGVYEALYEDSACQFLNLTVEAAETHLRQSPFDKVDLAYRTSTPGLRAGMLQHIAVPIRHIDADFLITSVKTSELPTSGRELQYEVQCVNGERADDWIDWFRRIADRSSYAVRDNEIVSRCNKLEATLVLASSASYISKPSAKWNDGSKWNGGAAWW